MINSAIIFNNVLIVIDVYELSNWKQCTPKPYSIRTNNSIAMLLFVLSRSW